MSGKKKGLSGCLIFAAIALVCLIAGGFYIKNKITNAVAGALGPYVAETAVELPPVDALEADVAATIQRLDDFKAAADAGTDTTPLELTSQDLNILITNHPDFAMFADKGRVAIEGDRVKANVSIPLDQAIPVVGGKFLNGTATFSAEVLAGRAALYIEDLQANGQTVSAAILTEMRKTNLLEQHPDALGEIDGLVIRDGKLILSVDEATSSGPVPAEPEAAASIELEAVPAQ